MTDSPKATGNLYTLRSDLFSYPRYWPRYFSDEIDSYRERGTSGTASVSVSIPPPGSVWAFKYRSLELHEIR